MAESAIRIFESEGQVGLCIEGDLDFIENDDDGLLPFVFLTPQEALNVMSGLYEMLVKASKRQPHERE